MGKEDSDFLSQQKVWNHRYENWDNWEFGEPLAPGEVDLAFHKKHLKPGGDVLILGTTKSLAALALGKTDSVLAVDFSAAAIDRFKTDGVEYICSDWISFLQETDKSYDNIITDNGLSLLEFPNEWHLIAEAIKRRLKDEGVFSMRSFVSVEGQATAVDYDNPNLKRIIPSMGRAACSENWMTIKPADGIRDIYPARYTFPPDRVVEDVFSDFHKIDKLQPGYEAGEHFLSYAFRK